MKCTAPKVALAVALSYPSIRYGWRVSSPALGVHMPNRFLGLIKGIETTATVSGTEMARSLKAGRNPPETKLRTTCIR